jgi:hypothetical protein
LPVGHHRNPEQETETTSPPQAVSSRPLLPIIDVSDHHTLDGVIHPVGDDKAADHEVSARLSASVSRKSGFRKGSLTTSCARSKSFLCRRRGNETKNSTATSEKIGRYLGNSATGEACFQLFDRRKFTRLHLANLLRCRRFQASVPCFTRIM